MWRSPAVPRQLKIRLVRAVVVPTWLYGYETWNLQRALLEKIDTEYRCMLRFALGIPYTMHVSTYDLMHDIEPITISLVSRALAFAGHAARARNQPVGTVLHSDHLLSHCRRLGKGERQQSETITSLLRLLDGKLFSNYGIEQATTFAARAQRKEEYTANFKRVVLAYRHVLANQMCAYEQDRLGVPDCLKKPVWYDVPDPLQVVNGSNVLNRRAFGKRVLEEGAQGRRRQACVAVRLQGPVDAPCHGVAILSRRLGQRKDN